MAMVGSEQRVWKIHVLRSSRVFSMLSHLFEVRGMFMVRYPARRRAAS